MITGTHRATAEIEAGALSGQQPVGDPNWAQGYHCDHGFEQAISVEGILRQLKDLQTNDRQVIAFGKDYAMLLRARRALAHGDADAALQVLASSSPSAASFMARR